MLLFISSSREACPTHDSSFSHPPGYYMPWVAISHSFATRQSPLPLTCLPVFTQPFGLAHRPALPSFISPATLTRGLVSTSCNAATHPYLAFTSRLYACNWCYTTSSVPLPHSHPFLIAPPASSPSPPLSPQLLVGPLATLSVNSPPGVVLSSSKIPRFLLRRPPLLRQSHQAWLFHFSCTLSSPFRFLGTPPSISLVLPAYNSL